MTSHSSSAPGKIILSGEYAVVFGYPGVAVPAAMSVEVAWEESGASPMQIIAEGLTGEEAYARRIIDACVSKGGPATGTVTIHNRIPVGRGLGSSTALVVALCRCLLGDDEKPQAVLIEDMINPGHSGLDFAVIWGNGPIAFTKGKIPEPVRVPLTFLQKSVLIDTGKSNETTPQLVAWMALRFAQGEENVVSSFEIIGRCTERLLAGENPIAVLRDHHRAQVALGVVPQSVQELIAEIENAGGAAKVLGAGARSGGGGMALALHDDRTTIETITKKHTMTALA